MKEKRLGIFRLSIIVVVLWGIVQPVSANSVERPYQERTLLTENNVNEYYHQDAEKDRAENNQGISTGSVLDTERENGSQNTVADGPAQIADAQSDDIIVLDFGPDDGVIIDGFLMWWHFDEDRGDGNRWLNTLQMRKPEIEALHLEIDLNQMSMSGTVKVSGVDDGDPNRLAEGEFIHTEGTAEISFWDVSVVWRESDERWWFSGESGEAQIAIEGSYHLENFISERDTTPYISDSDSTSDNVPVPFVMGYLTDELVLEVHAYNSNWDTVGTELEITIPQIELSIPRKGQPQQEEAPNTPQEELPQLEEAPALSDNLDAPFSINTGCDASIASGQDIDCNLSIQRENDDIGLLTVIWIMDGYVASEEQVLGDYSFFHFPNPPPGTHTVQVQVIDSQGNVRVAAVDVKVGGFASPDEAPDKIPPGAQTAAAVGTTALIAAWLWAEWMQAKSNALAEDRRDAKEAKGRQAWYEKQMARNDEVRDRQQILEAQQQALEAEWKRYRNALLELVKEHKKSGYLVDLLDDMQPDACQDGKWDANALRRLEGLINTHLGMDRQHEVQSEWKRMWDFYRRSEAELNSILRGDAMTGVELVAGLLTGGRSDLIFMPMKAISSAVYARRRAIMLGKTGWDAGKSVMKEAGSTLLTDYAVGKVVGGVVDKVIGGGVAVGRKMIGEEGAETVAKWWQKTGTKLGVIPKPAKNLPVIRQSWGRGPQVYLDRPIYRPGSRIPIGVGFENGLERIGRIDGDLANNVRRIIGEGAQVDPHINNILSPGNPSYTMTAQDDIAVSLMNNSSYKQAVREGLVPVRVQQAGYQTRDKFAKNAMMEAFQALDKIDLNGQTASSYLKSVTVTGTGSRPLNPRAVGRFTDWDATVVASADSGAVGREAEELFAAKFNANLRRAGVNADTAEISMFAGIHASPDAPIAGGYSSEGLTHWVKKDMIYQGQSGIRMKDGGMLFGAHPDVEPMAGFGPMDVTPRFPAVSGDVTGDARRIVEHHINARIAETGGPLDPLTVLRLEGKHSPRVWNANNAGSGADMPEWMNKVMRLKRDPDYHLSGAELDDVWKNYTDHLGLSPNIGGEG
ncbi:MAG: hypothetical protein U9Q82_03575 [Chloroflexota bacterium]|nr:hypothetical protein [Chloroflexota bacterium]